MPFPSLPVDQDYYEFSLDSEDATAPYNASSSKLDWPLFYVNGIKPLENMAGFKILEVQIPFSWYTFDSHNSSFVLTEQGQAPVTVTLAYGNYDSSQMTTQLAVALTHSSPQAFTYVVTFDPSAQKYTVYNSRLGGSEPFTLTFGGDDDTGNTNPRKLIGFNAGDNTSQTWDATNGDGLLAPNVDNVTGPTYLYLNSARLGSLVQMYLPVGAKNLGNGNAGPQIAKIPVNVNPKGIIVWSDPAPQYFFSLKNLKQLTSVDFYLTLGHTNETPLRLNGLAFSIKMGIVENLISIADYQEGNPSSGVKRIRGV